MYFSAAVHTGVELSSVYVQMTGPKTYVCNRILERQWCGLTDFEVARSSRTWSTFYIFLLCDAMLARYMLSSCVPPSVRLSVTSRYCIETTEWIELLYGMEASFHISHTLLWICCTTCFCSWQDFDWQRVARSVCGSRAYCFVFVWR